MGQERHRGAAPAVIRLHLVVEGQSERNFVEQLLAQHLGHFGVIASGIPVRTSSGGRRPDLAGRGGVSSWDLVRGHLNRLRRQHSGRDCRFGTMVDYYALPPSFPGYRDALAAGAAAERAAALEAAMAAEVADDRFIPYIQIHEFEALLLAEPCGFSAWYAETTAVARLASHVAAAGPPEEIDDGPETAPSKRIIAHLPSYRDAKPTASTLVARAIGIPAMRAKCPHFAEWLGKLEALGV